MLVYLGTLTTDAGSGPLHDLFSQAMPNELGRQNLFRSFGAWVGQGMYRVENTSAPFLRYHRSCCVGGDITQECETSIFKLDILQLEVCNGRPVILD